MDMSSAILKWAGSVETVRAILLVGSRARPGAADEFSDYDISLFGHRLDFIRTDLWLDAIAPHLICIHEKFSWGDETIPTRLVIFEDLEKADFAFHPLHLLQKMVQEQTLAPSYKAGYRILLDKDGLAAGLPPAAGSAYPISLPDAEKFSEAIHEFWFEAWHVAKFLAREDPWAAQSRAQAMRSWLLLMLQWDAAIGGAVQAKQEGRKFREWIRPEWEDKIAGCFSGWSMNEQQAALVQCARLFSRVSRENAARLGLPDDVKQENGIMEFITATKPISHVSKKQSSKRNHRPPHGKG